MRLRVGVVLCLFLAFLGAGCRKALEPNIDNNKAPETWITAAPQDTITTRDNQGRPIPPQIGRIPVRYHLYWAGADRDGAVAGFYWAVVETLPLPQGDNQPLPQLPGPKAQDYHFTARTDSIFVFHASEDISERQHAFYIFAVDNKGKPDPTPARFIFRAYDRFPPLAVIDELKAVGRTYALLGGVVVPQINTYFVHDSFDISRPFPSDTVPSGALLTMRWHGEPTISSTVVTGYRYKLDESDFNVVDSSVHMATYNTGIGADVVAPGKKVFTLRAVGESGWRGQATRYFQMNFAPDDWFSGPDMNDPGEGWSSYTDGNGKRYWYIDIQPVLSPNWATFTGIPGTMLSHDSVTTLPVNRPERRTFFEFYGDRIWAHQEGDTVSLNSWVVIPSGGFDADSPYRVKIGTDPNKPIGIVTQPDSANGSPIGFRSLVITRKIDQTIIRPSESAVYPVFDVASVYHAPYMAAYNGMATTGQAYAYAEAEDGDGTVDRRIQREGGPDSVIDRVDAGQGRPGQIAIRPKLLKFYVNHAPYLKIADGSFFPRRDTVITTRNGQFNILADDIDPIDDIKAVDHIGGPQSPPAFVLVRTVDFIGKGTTGQDTTVNVIANAEFANIPFSIPDNVRPGPGIVRIKLCDVRPSSNSNYGGRCITLDIPVQFTAPAPSDASSDAEQSTQRPGSPPATARRRQSP